MTWLIDMPLNAFCCKKIKKNYKGSLFSIYSCFPCRTVFFLLMELIYKYNSVHKVNAEIINLSEIISTELISTELKPNPLQMGVFLIMHISAVLIIAQPEASAA